MQSQRRWALCAAAVHDRTVRELPSGTVTFLFSDVEGSTRLLREYGEEAQDRLRESPISVRIGIHTGEPVVTSEGYVGMDVHRAARIPAWASVRN